MAVPEPWPIEDFLLLEAYRELVGQHDYECAEVIMDLLAAIAAAEELAAAVERGDGEAMAFHAGLVLRALETEHLSEFRIVE